jgi:3-hydroxyisobutyrate dehydrogenase-like beta-hydroxyacid dehydrogenase
MHDLTALREKAGAAGTVLIDCGVTSSPGGHSRKGIIGMVGADPAVFEYVREVLDDAMQQVFLMGGPGAGMATKIVRNLLYYATWRAASDSAELADAVGIDVGKLAAIHALSEQNGSAATVWFRARAARNEGVHAPSVGQQHLVDLMVKDLDAATSVSVEAGLDLPLIDIVRTGAHRTTEPWR